MKFTVQKVQSCVGVKNQFHDSIQVIPNAVFIAL